MSSLIDKLIAHDHSGASHIVHQIGKERAAREVAEHVHSLLVLAGDASDAPARLQAEEILRSAVHSAIPACLVFNAAIMLGYEHGASENM